MTQIWCCQNNYAWELGFHFGYDEKMTRNPESKNTIIFFRRNYFRESFFESTDFHFSNFISSKNKIDSFYFFWIFFMKIYSVSITRTEIGQLKFKFDTDILILLFDDWNLHQLKKIKNTFFFVKLTFDFFRADLLSWFSWL